MTGDANLQVRWEPGDLDRRLNRAAQDADQVLRHAFDELGRKGVGLMRNIAPIGPTGNYVARIGYTVDPQSVTIGSRAPHAHLVERGRRRGKMPPPALIQSLFDLPDIRQAFAVAYKIGKSGTRGRNVVKKLRTRLKPTVRRVFAGATASVVNLGGRRR